MDTAPAPRTYDRRSALRYALLATGCLALPRPARALSSSADGLFIWHRDALYSGERGLVLDTMESLGLTRAYIHVPSDISSGRVERFVASAAQRNVSVFLLVGDPSWALDPSGEAMIKQVERAADFEGIHGVLMDVEPHGTEQWDENPQQVLATYVEAMVHAKEKASQNGLELAACIPFYYEQYDDQNLLDTLVDQGCDRLCVMNYSKRNEIGQIAYEVELCCAYNKPLTVIYELQAVGTHGLKEYNTYHDDGLDAVQRSWEELCCAYPSAALSYALHDASTLLELLDL